MAYGLRLINNNATSGGNGRDWICFGDEAFRRGRAELPLSPKGSPAMEVRRAWQRERATERALQVQPGSLPSREVSRRGLPGIAVLQKWHRIHHSPAVNDREGLIDARPLPSVPQASNEELVHSRSTGALTDDPMMSWRAETMQKPTFPVPQYHYFSVPHVSFAKIPPPQPTDVPVKEVCEHAADQTEKYFYFSDPMITRSRSFVPEHPQHGLSRSKQASASRLRSLG
eukprot:Skav207317  [mRNA]  locus=scaffold3027:8455:23326:+ [translate_table: standard]